MTYLVVLLIHYSISMPFYRDDECEAARQQFQQKEPIATALCIKHLDGPPK